jgi:hypothetical protein
MRRLACLILFAACTATPATPPAHTPPPPDRPENMATAYGIVRDPAGRPVANARIRAWEAGPSCTPGGGPVDRPSGADGTYEITVGRIVGPAYEGCIVLEVAAGGAVERVERPSRFASDAAGHPRTRIDVTLTPAPLLTRAEADRLIALVRTAMHTGDHDATQELALYIGGADLSEQRRTVRGIADVRLLTAGDRRYEYELVGTRPGTSMLVTIEQDSLTRIVVRQR